MFPISHAATALILRKKFLISMIPLLIAVQLPGMLWAVLQLAGMEHYIPYPLFVLSMVGVSFISWLAMKKRHNKSVALAVSMGIISNIVLDLITGGSEIPVPNGGGPGLGLNLYFSPVFAAIAEIGYGVLCWRLARGRLALLATIILFNILNMPLLFHNRVPGMTSFIEKHPLVPAAAVVLQIAASSFFVWLFAKRPLSTMSQQEIKQAVSERYGKVATDPSLNFNFPLGRSFAESLGYPAALLDSLPPGVWKSFTGAGNPHGFIDLKTGERLLDMGCGAGLDLYIYSRTAGPTGKIYGLDISGNMLRKADANMKAVGAANVKLLHAPSDCIPLPDCSVDIVTANGIYNLSPDKDAVMREVYRVLRMGGRTTFAEIVLTEPFKDGEHKNVDEWFTCVGGAMVKEDFVGRMTTHGFKNVQVLWTGKNARTRHEFAVSAVISATK